MSRPIETAVTIDHRLEAALTAAPDLPASDVLLVCHPHPLHEGTMHNKVVTTLCRMGRDLGLPALRFNFRGVQNSQGVWDQGVGEIQDAIDAADWLLARYPGARLWLAGFSFGGYVAAQASRQLSPAGLLLVAPATSRFDMQSVRVDLPTWVAFNQDDDTVAPESMQAWLDQQPKAWVTEYIQPSGGHFYHGQLSALKRQAQAWLEGCL